MPDDKDLEAPEVAGELPDPTDETQVGEDTDAQEVDERGVPKKNVYAEFSRKLTKLEKAAQDAIRERDLQIQELQATLRTVQQRPVQAPAVTTEPQYTKDQLMTAFKQAHGDPELQTEVLGRLLQLERTEALTQQQQQNMREQVRAAWNQQAAQAFPQLSDSGSEFYRRVVVELQSRIQQGTVNEMSIWDAANAVANRYPDLVKRPANGDTMARGFGERSQTRPVAKKKDKLPEVDPQVWARYKQDFPQLSEERIRQRMKQIQERLVWGKNDE